MEEKEPKKKKRTSFLVRLLGICAFAYILVKSFLVIMNACGINDSWVVKTASFAEYGSVGILGVLSLVWVWTAKMNFILKLLLTVLIGCLIAFLLGYLPFVNNWFGTLTAK